MPPVTPGPVAARLANHRRRFAGNRRLVHGSDPFDDLPVAGNRLSRLHDHPVARFQSRRGNLLDGSGRIQAIGHRIVTGSPERFGLGLAAGLGKGSGEIGEQHGQEKPCVKGDKIA